MTVDKHPDDTRENYYAKARNWAHDQQEAQRVSARTAWIVASVAIGIAALEALALIALAPLKTVVPYTLLVDRNTGFAQQLKGTDVPQVGANTALTQSLLAQYVVAREGYDVATVSAEYRKVALWSAGKARADYLGLMPAGNPASPLARYGHGSMVQARVESVSMIGPQTAMVRFTTDETAIGQGGTGHSDYWVAVLHYRFSGEPMALEDRLVNPLGFQVVDYRRDQEAPPVATRGTLPGPVTDARGPLPPVHAGDAPQPEDAGHTEDKAP